MVIGASGLPGPGENIDRSGYVKVYYKDNHGLNWKKIGLNIGDLFGASVALSKYGSILAIGAPGYWRNRPGYVRVYNIMKEGDTALIWKQLGHNIIGEANGDQLGVSVSPSVDGNTLAVGANNNGENSYGAGCVRVHRWEENGSSWKQISQGIDGEAAYFNSGMSVSLSANDRTLAIGIWDGNAEKSSYMRVCHMEDD